MSPKYLVIDPLVRKTFQANSLKSAIKIAKKRRKSEIYKYSPKINAFLRIREYAHGKLIWKNPFGVRGD